MYCAESSGLDVCFFVFVATPQLIGSQENGQKIINQSTSPCPGSGWHLSDKALLDAHYIHIYSFIMAMMISMKMMIGILMTKMILVMMMMLTM